MRKIVLFLMVFTLCSGFYDVYSASSEGEAEKASTQTQSPWRARWETFKTKLKNAPQATQKLFRTIFARVKQASINGYDHYNGFRQSVKDLVDAMLVKGKTWWPGKKVEQSLVQVTPAAAVAPEKIFSENELCSKFILTTLKKSKKLDDFFDTEFFQEDLANEAFGKSEVGKRFDQITQAFLDITAQLRGQGIDASKIYAQIKHLPAGANIFFVGDIHGDLAALVGILNYLLAEGALDDNFQATPHNSFVFLGDYVDRGRQSKAVLAALFALKCLNPDCVFLMRGNHDDPGLIWQNHTPIWRRCFNEKNSTDLVTSKAVSNALLPELLLVASDGSVITASHAAPPYWDDAFRGLTDGFVQMRDDRYTKFMFHKDIKNGGGSGWNCVSGLDIVNAIFQPTTDHSVYDIFSSFVNNHGLRASFCGHVHPQFGHLMKAIEKYKKCLYKFDANQPFICFLLTSHFVGRGNNNGLDPILPFYYARLNVGAGRANWRLTFHPEKEILQMYIDYLIMQAASSLMLPNNEDVVKFKNLEVGKTDTLQGNGVIISRPNAATLSIKSKDEFFNGLTINFERVKLLKALEHGYAQWDYKDKFKNAIINSPASAQPSGASTSAAAAAAPPVAQ